MRKQLSQAQQFLSQDKVMKKLVQDFTLDREFRHRHEDSFYFLSTSIISQQLSSTVASVITKRYDALFETTYPSPHEVLQVDEKSLRGIGLSQRKSEYVKHLAQFFIDNQEAVKKIDTLSDKQIIELLIPIKGIGQWTIEMFLMFGLHREDVFSVGDLALFTSVKSLYNIKHQDKKKAQGAVLKIAEQWSPYRTFASFYLWKWYENLKKKVKK